MPDQAICKNLFRDYPVVTDPLKEIFKAQREFGSRFCPFKSLTQTDKVHWWRVFLDCILMELTELKAWTPWKHWKDYSGFTLEKEEIRFEIVDMLHFTVSLFLVIDRESNEVYQWYPQDQIKGDLDRLLLHEKSRLLLEYFIDPITTEAKLELTTLLLRDFVVVLGAVYRTPKLEYAISILELLLRLAVVWGLSGHDLYCYYMSKNEENFNRQERGY